MIFKKKCIFVKVTREESTVGVLSSAKTKFQARGEAENKRYEISY
jgi:hypothetical protein